MTTIIQPETLLERVGTDDLAILDVRTAAEFQDDHITHGDPPIVNIHCREFDQRPFEEIEEQLPEAETIVVVCWAGKCSQDIANTLEDHGIKALSLKGGMSAWRDTV